MRSALTRCMSPRRSRCIQPAEGEGFARSTKSGRKLSCRASARWKAAFNAPTSGSRPMTSSAPFPSATSEYAPELHPRSHTVFAPEALTTSATNRAFVARSSASYCAFRSYSCHGVFCDAGGCSLDTSPRIERRLFARAVLERRIDCAFAVCRAETERCMRAWRTVCSAIRGLSLLLNGRSAARSAVGIPSSEPRYHG
jgi:hypothetical protein